jgi:hypothetical protein
MTVALVSPKVLPRCRRGRETAARSRSGRRNQIPDRPQGIEHDQVRACGARAQGQRHLHAARSKVQRKVSDVVAGLAAAGSSLDREKSPQITVISAMQFADECLGWFVYQKS